MHKSNVLNDECPPPFEDFTDAAPAREASVVHSAHGRLRVHLPRWQGTRGEELADEAARFVGVTHAEANPLTGNLLILYQPGKTNVRTLLEALPCLRLQAPPAIRLVEESEPEPTAAATSGDYVTGARRILYRILGWGSVGMAVVGAITPGIPTAPFVILAGYFFIRSSPEAHKWLRESRWFGPILRDWEEYRGVRRPVRNAALGLIAFGMVVIPWLGLPPLLTISILSMQAIGIAIVLSLHVVDAEEADAPADVLPLRV
jgi:uncharacterized membrane protein YbaN (DUF454 family)